METLKTLTVEDLSELIGRKASTIRTDVSRRPESLPPRLRIPGSSKVLWLETDVRAWLESCRSGGAS